MHDVVSLMRDGVPLRAAAVLFGSARQLESEMPQCLLRVARSRGADRSEFLDNRQSFGNAFALLASSERFLTATIPIASRFEPGRVQRIDEPPYPPLAVREAVANALCHRDYAMGGGSVRLAVYDDRLEVTSTGPLHFDLTPDAAKSAPTGEFGHSEGQGAGSLDGTRSWSALETL